MRTYTAKQLLTCHHWCRTHPNGRVPIDRMEIISADEWLRWFRQCLDKKISSHMPHVNRGRKWGYDWQIQAWRTSREVNTPRLIVRWIPREFLPRLTHRLHTEER
jgi:hypothetical protein